jgi:GH25 family lysozyme M1 (1,4-beta-N-acetylmuramidase)
VTIYGWDASDYDWTRGPMDLRAAAQAGIQFFTHKATEGASVRHRHLADALSRARTAGIPVLGAYHVVRSSPSAQAQVDYCLRYLDEAVPWWRTHPAFFIQVDLERWPYDSVPASAGEAFADLAQAQSDKVAVIYASKGQYGDGLTGTSHPLWNANYGTNPVADFRTAYARAGGDSGAGWTTYSGRMSAIWQYGSKARIGSQSTCDANAFRGTLDELRTLLTDGDDMALTEAESGALGTSWQDAAAWLHGWDDAPGGGGPHWGVRALKTLAGRLDQVDARLAALAAAPPGTVNITDEQLERVLRKVIGSVDGASPAS